MIVFYDPNDSNQVMALYTGGTNSVAWTDQGFVRAEVNDPELQEEIDRYARDCTVAVVDGQVTGCTSRVNRVQPIPDPRIAARQAAKQSGKAKLSVLGLSEEEIEALVG